MTLFRSGLDYGYFANASKTYLIVKEGYKDEAESIFEGTRVDITEEGSRYLGSAIERQSFIESYVQQKVVTWVDELERLVHNYHTTSCSLCCLHTWCNK